MTGTKSNRVPVYLKKNNRFRLEALAEWRGLSLSETLNYALAQEYQRVARQIKRDQKMYGR